MTSPHDADLIVVGGGPVGVSMALFAAVRGLAAIVVEREPEVYNTARAIGMDDEVQRIFQGVGMLEELQAITTPAKGAEFVDAAGQRIIGIDLPDGTTTGLGHPPTVFYHQPDLEALLRLRALDVGVELLLAHEMTNFSASADGVSTMITDLVDGTASTLRTRWMVGADGASSRVRKAVGIEFEDQGFDQDWLVVDTKLLRDVDLPIMPRQMCDPARPVTFVPGFDRARRWEFQLQPGETREEMVQAGRVWELLAPWIAPGDVSIERAVVYRFHATVAATMRAGNVFLAGDAAHQMPPFLGQGLCAGIRDAANLAWRLEAVWAGRGHDRLLDGYGIERRSHAADVVAHAVETGRLIDQLAGRSSGAIGTEAGYGGGRPFPYLHVGQLAGDHPLTGRQLPQPLIDGELLDARLGNQWAVISADRHAIADDVRRGWLDVGAGIVELGNDYDAIAFAPAGGVIIVRPDRIVAAASADPIELATLSAELLAWFVDDDPPPSASN